MPGSPPTSADPDVQTGQDVEPETPLHQFGPGPIVRSVPMGRRIGRGRLARDVNPGRHHLRPPRRARRQYTVIDSPGLMRGRGINAARRSSNSTGSGVLHIAVASSRVPRPGFRVQPSSTVQVPEPTGPRTRRTEANPVSGT